MQTVSVSGLHNREMPLKKCNKCGSVISSKTRELLFVYYVRFFFFFWLFFPVYV